MSPYATGVAVVSGLAWGVVAAFSLDGALDWLGVDSERIGIGACCRVD
jgi:hypothetical protein